MVAGVVMEMHSVQIFDLLLSVSCLKIDTSYLQKKGKKYVQSLNITRCHGTTCLNIIGTMEKNIGSS